MWHCYQCQWYQITKRLFCTTVQLSWPKDCSGVIYNAIGIIWCHWHWCQHQKCHVAPHFSCLNLITAMMPLMMLLDQCCTSFQLSSPNKCSCIIYNAIDIMWCHTGASGITWPKTCYTSWFSWANKCSYAIDIAINITWCWCKYQMHHMTKKSCCISF